MLQEHNHPADDDWRWDCPTCNPESTNTTTTSLAIGDAVKGNHTSDPTPTNTRGLIPAQPIDASSLVYFGGAEEAEKPYPSPDYMPTSEKYPKLRWAIRYERSSGYTTVELWRPTPKYVFNGDLPPKPLGSERFFSPGGPPTEETLIGKGQAILDDAVTCLDRGIKMV